MEDTYVFASLTFRILFHVVYMDFLNLKYAVDIGLFCQEDDLQNTCSMDTWLISFKNIIF